MPLRSAIQHQEIAMDKMGDWQIVVEQFREERLRLPGEFQHFIKFGVKRGF